MELTIKNNYLVRPKHPTLHGCLSLSELDQIGAMIHPQGIYFYKPSISCETSCHARIADTLRDSLSRVLIPFYPLAGRLRWIDQEDQHHQKGRLELDCNDKGVVLIEVELNVDLASFGDFTPSPNYQYLFPAIDYNIPIHELPVMFVQLTKFKCGGISLSFAISHVVADGTSVGHFLREWARLARGETLEILPFHDRNVLQARDPPVLSPRLEHSEDLMIDPPDLIQLSGEEEKRMKRTVIQLRLSQKQVERLKKLANDYSNINIGASFTRYEAIAAHLWRTMCKARNHEDEQQTRLFVTINSRRRLQPPLPIGYFGNGILDLTATSTAGELVSKPLGYGASRVRDVINKITNTYMFSAIEYLKKQQDLRRFRFLYLSSPEDFIGNPSVWFLSWLNLPMYDMDFGWGKEAYFGPGELKLEGESVLFESRDGDGSLVLLICLFIKHVDAFKKYFYEDLMNTSS